MASRFDGASRMAKPPMTSLASVNGPSVAVILPLTIRMRTAVPVVPSPPVETTDPSLRESSVSFPMASSSAWGGAPWFSADFTIERNRTTTSQILMLVSVDETTDAAPSPGYRGRQDARDERQHGRRHTQRRYRGDGSTERNNGQPSRGDRREALADVEEPGQDQAKGAGHLANADELDERCRERRQVRQHGERHCQLEPAGEQEQSGEQPLDDPQRNARPLARESHRFCLSFVEPWSRWIRAPTQASNGAG